MPSSAVTAATLARRVPMAVPPNLTVLSNRYASLKAAVYDRDAARFVSVLALPGFRLVRADGECDCTLDCFSGREAYWMERHQRVAGWNKELYQKLVQYEQVDEVRAALTERANLLSNRGVGGERESYFRNLALTFGTDPAWFSPHRAT